jgi:hypothetical protein
MAKEEEYILNGLDSVTLADRATSSRDKLRLLQLAEGWLELADRVRRRGPGARKNAGTLIAEG